MTFASEDKLDSADSRIVNTRLARQQLAAPRFGEPGALVEYMTAVQGQDYAGTKWAIARRLDGAATEASIENALVERVLVRTWAQRGTLQIVHARDARRLITLFGPRIINGNQRRYRELDLDATTLRRSNDALANVLQGGKTLLRRELYAVLEAHGISTAGQRGIYMLQRASLDSLICQGVAIRNQPSFYSLHLLPHTPDMDRDEALANLARRYFTARGPATIQDFTWWSGLSAADAHRAIDAAQPALDSVKIDETTCWLCDALETTARSAPSVHLLPPFDEYLLSYKDRRAMLDEEHARKIHLANGLAMTVVLDGRVIGVWRRTIKKNSVDISFNLTKRPTSGEREALESEAGRYAQYLQRTMNTVYVSPSQ